MRKILLLLLLGLGGGSGYAQYNTPDNSTGVAPGNTITDQMPADFPGGILVNSVRSTILREPVTSPAAISALSPGAYLSNASYSDGLGRTIQTVQRNASSRGDVISTSFFDSTGRQPIRLLPYSSGLEANGNFKRDASSGQKAYYNGNPNSLATGDNSHPYSKIVIDDGGLGRQADLYVPGIGNVGRNVGIRNTTGLSVGETEIRKWVFNGFTAVPTTTGKWASGELIVRETQKTNGKRERVYTDRDGRTILSKTQAGASAGADHDGWLCTYYVYDEYNRIRQVIPPKAVDLIKNSGWSVSSTSFNNLCWSIDYDKQDRVIAKKVPGQEKLQFVYDQQDRVVLVQDGKLTANGDWLFTKYDAFGRVIVLGRFLNSGNESQASLQSLIDAQSPPSNLFIRFLKAVPAANDYLPSSVIPDAEIYSLACFDQYNSAPSGMAFDDSSVQRMDASGAGMVPALLGKQNLGLNTLGFSRIMDGTSVTNSWISTVIYYDDHGRMLQSQQINQLGGHDTLSVRYNFSGQPVYTFSSTNNPIASSSNIGSVRVYKWYEFDGMGRPRAIYQKINTEQDWRRLNAFVYDDLGNKIKLKTYGKSAETQDYRYRIWGGLESINRLYCDAGGTQNFFGEIISYDYGFSSINKLYPAGMKWRMKGTSNIQRAYGYSYDEAGRLTSADYSQSTDNISWDNTAEDYSSRNMSYDANGNLTHMDQWGTKPGMAPFKMDNLSYVYKNGGISNQLESVSDSVTTDFGLGEFTEAATSSQDYSYDANGNAIQDVNKGISSILYDHSDKPYQIDFGNGRRIHFVYTAGGTLLKKTIEEPGQTTKNIHFLGNSEYVDSQLAFVQHEEGRTRPVQVTLANGAKLWSYEYDYFIKDHQGNTRSVITEAVDSNFWVSQPNPTDGGMIPCIGCFVVPPTNPVVIGYTMSDRHYTVTNELANSAVEEGTFDHVGDTRDTKPQSTDPNDQKATRLNEGEGKIIGPSIILSVTAGDMIGVSTGAFFENQGEVDYNSNVSIDQLVGSLVSALSGQGAYQTLNEGGASGEVTAGALSNSPFLAAMQQIKLEHQSDGQSPQAFLNYIFLDEHMNVVEDQSGFKQATVAGDWNQLVVPQMEVKRSGYVVVFLSNESSMNVHFDNLNLTHYKGKLLEESHYYPYGLTVTKKAFVQAADNNDLFLGNRLNRNEFTSGTGLNWYDMGARQYDPQIGRWHVADPYASAAPDWSPYRYAFDNPVAFSDPSGLYEEGFDGWDDGDGPGGSRLGCIDPNSSDNNFWGDVGQFFTQFGDAISEAAQAVGNGAADALSAEGDPEWSPLDAQGFEDGARMDGFGGDPEDHGWAPLTKDILRSYANQMCVTCNSRGLLENYTGNVFENAWNNTAIILGLTANDNYRPNKDKVTGGIRPSVPDGISDGFVRTGFLSKDIRVPDAAYFEVKAKDGTLYNSSNSWQIAAHISNLVINTPPKYLHYGALQASAASLTIITTAGVSISKSVLALANSANVILYHYEAQYMMIGSSMLVRFELTEAKGKKMSGFVTPPVKVK